MSPGESRNLQQSADDIAEIGVAAGMLVDSASSMQIAGWGYASAVQGGARAWVAANQYELVNAGYDALFAS